MKVIRKTLKDRVVPPAGEQRAARLPLVIAPEVYAQHRKRLEILLNRFMTDKLRSLYQAFDGDLLLFLVLVEVASLNIGAEHYNYARKGGGGISKKFYLPCGIAEVSRTSGIPRETVRRRLKTLVELGWLKEVADRKYVIADKYAVLTALIERQLVDLLEVNEEIQRILKPRQVPKI